MTRIIDVISREEVRAVKETAATLIFADIRIVRQMDVKLSATHQTQTVTYMYRDIPEGNEQMGVDVFEFTTPEQGMESAVT